MISVALKPGFSARELLEMTLGGLRTAFLKTLAQGGIALACLLNLLSTESLTIGRGSQIDDAQVNTQDVSGVLW